MLDATDSDFLADTLASVAGVGAVADSTSTYVGLRWLGTIEGTPAVAELIAKFGLLPGLVIRTIIAAAVVAIAWKLVTVQHLRLAVLTALGTLYVGVVGWNLAIMYG